MDPYLTPADRLRADAQGLENQSIRADWAAEDYERAGNYMHACIQYRRSATLLRASADRFREAHAAEGGTQAYLDQADLLTRAADHRDRWATGLTSPPADGCIV